MNLRNFFSVTICYFLLFLELPLNVKLSSMLILSVAGYGVGLAVERVYGRDFSLDDVLPMAIGSGLAVSLRQKTFAECLIAGGITGSFVYGFFNLV